MGHSGNNAVIFQSCKDAYFLVSEELQVVYTAVPAVHGDKGRFQAPVEYFAAHLLKIIILGFAITMPVHPKVYRHTNAFVIRIMKHNEINTLDLLVMPSTPKIPH